MFGHPNAGESRNWLKLPPSLQGMGDHSMTFFAIPKKTTARRCFSSSHLLFSSKICRSSLKCVVVEAEAEGCGPKNTRGGPDKNGELSPKQRLFRGENGELSHKNGMIDDYKTYSGDTVELDINNNMIYEMQEGINR